MKKAAILTFWKEENYGAILQACALQDALRSLDVSAELIDFSPPHKKLPLPKKLLGLAWRGARSFLGFRKRLLRTDAFRKRWIHASPAFNDDGELMAYLETKDFCVVGSDQVWNPQIVPAENNIFLLEKLSDSVPKFSYAASFGVSMLNDGEKAILRRCLRKFQAISVREQTGQKLLDEMGIPGAELVSDPTLLLTPDQWADKAAALSGKFPYILCYIMPGKEENPAIYALARKLLSQKKISDVVYLGDREYKRFFRRGADVSAGPAEFLSYFANAAYVITNSFHGTCFSVNFRKNFISVVENADPSRNRNSRIVDFLTPLGLEGQIFRFNGDISALNQAEIRFDVDYSKAGEILERQRNRSIAFLTRTLETGISR